MGTSWALEWSHGRTTVHAGAGAIGNTEFHFDGGGTAAPFHEAPWVTRGETVEPSSLNHLRGEWPCLPFGRPYGPCDELVEPWASLASGQISAADEPLVPGERLLHGHCASTDWSLVSRSDRELILAVDLPDDQPIAKLTRSIRPVDGLAALDVSVEVVARRSCSRPFGFHPNFALRGAPGSFSLEPRAYRFGLTHPSSSPIARAKPNERFTDLAAVPLAGGGHGQFAALPFPQRSEDILQLCGIEGGIRLVDDDARVAWELTWDSTKLPSCLLWMSNRGRQKAPWNGENLCIGVEPVASAFDLGPAVATAANPIAAAGVPTAIWFEAGRPVEMDYRISASRLPRDG